MSFLNNPIPLQGISQSVSVVQPPTQFIILHTIDIEESDMNTFKSWNVSDVIKYDYNVEAKLPISQLNPFVYLFLDLRIKEHREYFDNNDTNSYHVICYISILETFDALIESIEAKNVITDIPIKQHLQSDFNNSLLAKKTEAPNKILSCINFCSSYLSSLKKTTA